MLRGIKHALAETLSPNGLFTLINHQWSAALGFVGFKIRSAHSLTQSADNIRTQFYSRGEGSSVPAIRIMPF